MSKDGEEIENLLDYDSEEEAMTDNATAKTNKPETKK
jgi:hypothetical protein